MSLVWAGVVLVAANVATELAGFYLKRFRDEFRPAFQAWVANRPRTNDDAPLSPFAMPEYKLAASLIWVATFPVSLSV